MVERIINDKHVFVDPKIAGFKLFSKPSSNVEYFGIESSYSMLFVQFKNGSSYVFRDVPINILNEIQTAESVGKYFSQNVAGKFQSVKYADRMVTETLFTP